MLRAVEASVSIVHMRPRAVEANGSTVRIRPRAVAASASKPLGRPRAVDARESRFGATIEKPWKNQLKLMGVQGFPQKP